MKKKNVIIIIIVAVVVLMVFSLVLGRIGRKTKDVSFDANIKVDLVLNDDTSKVRTIEIVNSGKNAIVKTNYLDGNIYINSDGMFYLNGGRYKKIKTEDSYIDIYKLLTKIEKGKKIGEHDQEEIYNPVLSVNQSNELLNILHTGMSTNRTMNSHLSLEKNKLKYFRVTYEDIEDYKSVSISVNFNVHKGDCNIPKIYSDLIDEVDSSIINING